VRMMMLKGLVPLWFWSRCLQELTVMGSLHNLVIPNADLGNLADKGIHRLFVPRNIVDALKGKIVELKRVVGREELDMEVVGVASVEMGCGLEKALL